MCLDVRLEEYIAALKYLSEVYERQEDFKTLEIIYGKLIEVSPADTESLIGLSQVYSFTDRESESENLLLKVIKLDEKNRFALESLVEIYMDKNPKKAVDLCTSILDKHPNYVFALELLAFLYSSMAKQAKEDVFLEQQTIQPLARAAEWSDSSIIEKHWEIVNQYKKA